jgi:hypothetical protein
MVALAPAAGDEGVAPLGHGVGAEVGQLAGLVAAACQPGAVIPLHMQGTGGEAEHRAQAVHGLKGRGQMSKARQRLQH